MPLKTLNPFTIAIAATKDDTSDRVKKVQKVASETYSILVICLVYNLVAVSKLWFHGVIETRILCLAIAYLLLGLPAARFSWYRELNLAFDGDKNFNFHWFLVVYVIHIVFCLFAWLDPFAEKSLAGITSVMVLYFDDGLGYDAFFYFVVSMFFFIEYVMSIWVLCNVHKLYIQGAFSSKDYLEGINGSINV